MTGPLILGKIAAIERSVARAREEFAAAGSAFRNDFTRQDAAILNILRACESAIDLANILIRERGLGIPQSSRDSFKLLADAKLIAPDSSARLQRMIGFRNIAVINTGHWNRRSSKPSCRATWMTCWRSAKRSRGCRQRYGDEGAEAGGCDVVSYFFTSASNAGWPRSGSHTGLMLRSSQPTGAPAQNCGSSSSAVSF